MERRADATQSRLAVAVAVWIGNLQYPRPSGNLSDQFVARIRRANSSDQVVARVRCTDSSHGLVARMRADQSESAQGVGRCDRGAEAGRRTEENVFPARCPRAILRTWPQHESLESLCRGSKDGAKRAPARPKGAPRWSWGTQENLTGGPRQPRKPTKMEHPRRPFQMPRTEKPKSA